MRVAVALVVAVAITPAIRSVAAAPDQNTRNIAGTWTLNTWLTDGGDQIHQEVSADLGPSNRYDISGMPEQARPVARDAMGRRVHGGMDPIRPTSGDAPRALLTADDHLRLKSLLDSVELPATTLTITQASSGITVVDPLRGTRTFLPNGEKQKQSFDSGTIESVTRWEGPQLLTDYAARRGVSLRFSYMLVPSDDHLLVRISVLTPGDEAAPYVIRHVYDRAKSAAAGQDR